MENHKSLNLKNESINIDQSYLDYFSSAFNFVQKYYKEEYDRIKSTNFDSLSMETFWQEYIWSVYTSGFNAKVVSKFFPRLMEIYDPLFVTFSKNNKNVNTLDIATNALEICNNKRKVKAIIDTAFDSGEQINKFEWNKYKFESLDSPEKLQKLAFIGPVTCFHLARNIGHLNYVKPDIHLNRIAAHWGFRDPLELCREIQKSFPIELGLIDLCLWYALSSFGSKL